MSEAKTLSEQVERFRENEEKVDTLVNGAAGNTVNLGGTTRPTLNGLMEEISGEAFRAQAVQNATACAKYWALQANAIATDESVIATGDDEARTLPDWFADVLTLKKAPAARFTEFGGQLAALRRDLLTPNKPVGIAFCGDSITWGAKATGCPAHVSNSKCNYTLRDMRDGASSASYVNNFKRWVGDVLAAAIMHRENEDDNGTPNDLSDDVYEYGVSASYSNYSDLYPAGSRSASPTTTSQVSSVGESIVEYTLQQELSFFSAFFSQSTAGNGSISEVVNTLDADDNPVPGYRFNRALKITGAASGDSGSVSFNFTGAEIIIYYTQDSGSLPYSIYVNGALHTENGVSSFSTSGTFSAGEHRTHSIGPVTDATVEIRASGSGSLVLESIILPKVVTISNNGISGASVYNYTNNCAPNYGGTKTPAQNAEEFHNCAVPGDYVFVQLGANDRTEQPKGNPAADSLLFQEALATLLLKFQSYGCYPIVMCGPPAVLQLKHFMDMAEVRLRVIEAARAQRVDFIDNYSIFNNLPLTFFLDATDKLHPNDTGHMMIANNIIAALTSAAASQDFLSVFGGTLSGNVAISKNNPHLGLQQTGVQKGTAPGALKTAALRFSDRTNATSNSGTLGMVQSSVAADGTITMKVAAFKPAANSTDAASIDVVYPTDGDPYMKIPPNGVNDGTTQTTANYAATAGFVRSLIAALETRIAALEED